VLRVLRDTREVAQPHGLHSVGTECGK
jgi:hypothetical protein